MSEKRLRVVSVQAENVMRLRAVEIKWDADAAVLTVGGANGAGKSSVLNAVAMALGGMALCPDEPLRQGETTGFVEVNLGDLLVRRDFSRDALPCNCDGPTHVGHVTLPPTVLPAIVTLHSDTCDSHRFGETKSRITVRNVDGVRLGTPQAVLDKIISKFSFDPLEFVALGSSGAEGRRRQEELLRRIVGLDLTDLAERLRQAEQARTHWNRELKAATSVLDSMVHHGGVPAVEIPAEEIATEFKRASELVRVADEARRSADAALSQQSRINDGVITAEKQLEQARARVLALEEEHAKALERSLYAQQQVEAASAAALAAAEAVPDITVVQNRITEIGAINAKVRANQVRAEQATTVEQHKARAEKCKTELQQIAAEKAARLQAVAFPVPGLGLADDGVTFNGIPFQQASTAEQIRVSVAVGFALNPGLPLLLVRNGNALDEDSMKLVASQAAAAGGQILMEYVTKDAAAVSVLIEDGGMKIN